MSNLPTGLPGQSWLKSLLLQEIASERAKLGAQVKVNYRGQASKDKMNHERRLQYRSRNAFILDVAPVPGHGWQTCPRETLAHISTRNQIGCLSGT